MLYMDNTNKGSTMNEALEMLMQEANWRGADADIQRLTGERDGVFAQFLKSSDADDFVDDVQSFFDTVRFTRDDNFVIFWFQ